jgi:hypothetical protein
LKKAATISLLAVIFYTQLGYFGQFVIQQSILKEEAREAWVAALPDQNFYRIQLAAVEASGHWTEPGRECWYKNHLYDVIRAKTEGGVVWLYCMDDEREATLIRKSGEVTHANQDGPDKKANHSLSPRIGDWLAETTSLRLDRPLKAIDRHYGDRTRPLSAGCKETIAPPPKS